MIKKNTAFEALKYLIFGVSAALVNFLFYVAFSRFFKLNTAYSSTGAWIFANLYSFWVNHVFVFRVKSKNFVALITSCAIFLLSRLLSGFGDVGLMYLFCDVLHFNDLVMKVIITSLLGMMNYIIGKFIIFSKKETNKDPNQRKTN